MKQNDEIYILLEALKYFYPVYFGEDPHPIKSFFDYKGRKYSKDWVLSETFRISQVPEKTSDIGVAIRELEKIAGSKFVEPPKKVVESNRPDKDTLEQFEKENEAKETLRKEVVEKSNREVRDAIKRQQEIYAEQIQKAKAAEAALKNKKIYYKVEKVSVKDTQEVQNLKEQAKANPQEYIKDATNQFSKNPNLKNLSKAEAEIVSRQAAVTSYEVLTDNSPLIQSVIISRVASDPKILDSISNFEIREYFKNAAELLTNQKLSQYELSKQLLNFSKIDGHENVNDVKIEFSSTPQPGFKEFDFNDQIIAPHIENLNQQNLFLDSLEGLGEGEIKSQILLSVGNKLTSYISTLPADSLLAQTYNSELVQLGLARIGFVEAVPLAAESWGGNVLIATGLGYVGLFVQTKTGIDLGIKVAAKEVGKQAVEKGLEVAGKVATTGGEVAVKGTVGVGVAAGITAAFAWTGPLAPIIGAIGSFLVSTIATKVVVAAGRFLKNIAQKYGKYLVAAVGAGFGFLIGGSLLGAAIGGVIGFGGAVAFSAGLPALGAAATSFGSGILTFFGVIAGAMLGSIVAPVLGFLLGFPLMVALILFIINSGAYVVPPSISLLGSENPYIDIAKTSDPAGPFENSDLPKIVTYTITITAKQQALTNVVVKDECSVISEAGSRDCPAPDIVVPGGTISGGSPFVFTYTANFDKSYEDSLVVNTVTVTADTEEGGDPQTATGGLSITIGTPPTDCLKIDGAWPANYKANMESAVGTLASKYSNYLSKVCLSYGEIPLRFSPVGYLDYWGWNEGEYITFYPLGVKSPTDALYILAHELGHSLSWGSKTAYIFATYRAYPGIESEAPYCFYAETASWNKNESLPESIALTVIEPYCGSVQSRWPRHATFLRTYVFN